MKQVTIPTQWLQELIALCGPEDHELRERVMVSITAMDEQAAAPVVLPEPEAAIVEVMELVKDWAERDFIAAEAELDAFSEEATEKVVADKKHLDDKAEEAYRAIETKLRALLAGVSAPAALAVERIVHLRVDRQRRIYVAGPMTGLPEFNFPAFNSAADKLRAEEWHVENPAEHGHIEGADWADYLRWDISRIATCGAIYLLPGWENSKGATLEVSIAKALGMQFILAPGAAPQAQADARDAELLRGLHGATSLLGTPEGDAYQEAMQAEAMKVSDTMNGEIAKASIEQYRGILEAGLTAARAAIAAQAAQQTQGGE